MAAHALRQLAARRVRNRRAFTANGGGRSNIYLVLLDYSDRRGDAHGVYVGMSRYSPAQRFDQHKAGIRAAGSVLKRGIEVLTGPTLHLQRIKRGEAARIEAALAVALADAASTSRAGTESRLTSSGFRHRGIAIRYPDRGNCLPQRPE